MPVYATICESCGHRGEVVKGMKEPFPPCATIIAEKPCGGTLRVDWTLQSAPKMPAHDFTGTRSEAVDVGCRKFEVQECRELFGPGIGHVFQADGKVKFASRAEAKRFYAREDQVKRELREKLAAGKIKTRKQMREDAAAKRLTPAEKAQMKKIKERAGKA